MSCVQVPYEPRCVDTRKGSYRNSRSVLSENCSERTGSIDEPVYELKLNPLSDRAWDVYAVSSQKFNDRRQRSAVPLQKFSVVYTANVSISVSTSAAETATGLSGPLMNSAATRTVSYDPVIPVSAPILVKLFTLKTLVSIPLDR